MSQRHLSSFLPPSKLKREGINGVGINWGRVSRIRGKLGGGKLGVVGEGGSV